MKSVLLFSGQGSQYHQMGRELYDNHPRFRHWMDACEEIIHPLVGLCWNELLYGNLPRSAPFERLLHTNPALVSVQYSMARALMDEGFTPSFLAGYSLGELVAAVVAGCYSLEDGLRLSVEVARLVEESTPPAAMLAILAPREILASLPSGAECLVTGTNFPGHFVAGGPPQSMFRLEAELRAREIAYQRLSLTRGFHTPMIAHAEGPFRALASKLPSRHPTIPVFSSLSDGFLTEISPDYLWRVFRHPVEFQTTANRILRRGDHVFVDAGPSGTLTTFIKYNLPSESSSATFPTMNPFGKDLASLDKLRRFLGAAIPSNQIPNPTTPTWKASIT